MRTACNIGKHPVSCLPILREHFSQFLARFIRLIYQKFNERLFEERYLAWVNGAAANEPTVEGWYKGEIGFFDHYICPTAEKLDTCGVFGVSYHEYLNYSKQNRKEWERKGRRIATQMLANCRAKYGKAAEPEHAIE